MASTYELIVKAVDQSSGNIKKIDRNLDRLNKKANRVGKALRAAGGALAAVVTGRTVASVVNATARFQDLETSLNAVAGGAEEGAKAFDFVKKFATKTQFGVEELTKSFISLKANGVEPTEKLLTTFTDTAAVTTDQIGALEAMTKLFSRAAAGAGITLEDLDILADRGIPVYKILADQIGVTRGELTEFAKQGNNTQVVLDALTKGLDQSFGGATAARASNLSTAMSNFGIAVTEASVKLGNEFRPQLTAAITEATAFINTNDQLVKSMGQGLGVAIENTADALKLIAANIDLIGQVAQTVLGVKLIQYTGNVIKQVGGATKSFGNMFKKIESGNKTLTKTQKRIVSIGNTFGKIGEMGTKLGTALSMPFRSLLGIMGSVASRVVALRIAFAGLAAFAPLLLNPWTLAIAGIGAAAYGLFKYFEDSYFKIGDMTTSVGEVVRAVWLATTKKIAEWWTSLTQYIGDAVGKDRDFVTGAWKAIKDNAAKYIEPIQETFLYVFRVVTDKLTAFGDNVIGTFVFIYRSIAATIQNIPQIFSAIFKGIVTTAVEFGGSLVTQFANIGKAIIMALKAPFTEDTLEEALKLATTNAFAGLGDTVAQEIDKVSKTMPDFGKIAGEAFGGGYMEGAGEKLKTFATQFRITAGEAVAAAGEAFVAGKATFDETVEGLRTTLQGLITEYRQQKFEIELAAGAYDTYDDAVLRAARGMGVLKGELKSTGDAAGDAGNTVDEAAKKFQGLLNKLVEESIEAANSKKQNLELYQALLKLGHGADVAAAAFDSLGLKITDLPAGQQVGKLEELVAGDLAAADAADAAFERYKAAGKRTEQELAAARSALGIAAPAKPKEAELTTTQQLVKSYQDQNKELAELQAGLANVSVLAREAGVSEQFMAEKLQERMEGLDVYKDRALDLATTMKDAFKKVGDSLADNLADAIVEGKSLMDVFKNAFKSVLKEILSAIIKSGIKKALGGLFGGGGGLMGGGLFGGGTLLGGLFGGFLASGGPTNPAKGYVVGEKGPEFFMPGTTGRVVPNDEVGGASQQPVVNFNISAIDTQTGTEFILKNKKQIEGVVNDAYNRRGKVGIA